MRAMCLALALFASPTPLAWAGEPPLRVAVAANFRETLVRVADLYRAAGGTSLEFSSAASGILYHQVRRGAPFDVFLSADLERPRQLETDGLAVAGSRFTYARGILVLWAPRLERVPRTDDLLDRRNRIGIANPSSAPYGQAAREVLNGLGVTVQPPSRLVRGNSVAQVVQMAATGHVDLAFIGAAQVPDRAVALRAEFLWWVPDDLYRPIDQQAVQLAAAHRPEQARLFLEFLRGPVARRLIRDSGYLVPDAAEAD